MGFEQRVMSKPTTYIKIGTEKENDGKTIKNKFFAVTRKEDNKWVVDPKVDQNGFPTPLFAYLMNIQKRDRKMTVNGAEITSPEVTLDLMDDSGAKFQLAIPFTNQEGRVSNYLFGLLNSLASIKQFGYMKFYIVRQNDKVNDKLIRFNLLARNAVNWVAGSKDYGVFSTDSTKLNWEFETKDIPKYMEEVLNGKGKSVKQFNLEEHQEFFENIIISVSEMLKEQSKSYDIGENASASMNNSLSNVSIDDADDNDETPEFEAKPETVGGEEGDEDLPF